MRSADDKRGRHRLTNCRLPPSSSYLKKKSIVRLSFLELFFCVWGFENELFNLRTCSRKLSSDSVDSAFLPSELKGTANIGLQFIEQNVNINIDYIIRIHFVQSIVAKS